VECELLPNVGRLVCPEFVDAREKVVLPKEGYVRPDDYDIWVSADLAWEDYSGVIFVIVDRRAGRAIQVDEIFAHYLGTRQLAEMIKWKVSKLFPEIKHAKINYVADATPDRLYDLRTEYGLHFRSAYRHDKEASIARFRSAVASGDKVQILDNCVETTFTLGNLLWNAKRTDFERSTTMGHGDIFDAWRYLWRVIRLDGRALPPLRRSRDSRVFENPYAEDNWMRSGHSRKTVETVGAIFGDGR